MMLRCGRVLVLALAALCALPASLASVPYPGPVRPRQNLVGTASPTTSSVQSTTSQPISTSQPHRIVHAATDSLHND